MHLSAHRCHDILAAFPNQRIVVVGDVMLDHLVTGDARRISPEAPIPVIQFRGEVYTPGGAGNVARNVSSLGAQVDVIGAVGDDPAATILRDTLVAHGISADGLVAEAGRPTTVKTRISAHRQQVVRLDRETTRPLGSAASERLISAWRAALTGASAVIVADYAKGVVEQAMVSALLADAKRHGVPVCVDPKPSHRLDLRGCAVLTPNRKETFELAERVDPGAEEQPTQDSALLAAVGAIQSRFNPEILLVTLSEAGLLLVEAGQEPRHIPTFARQVFDVTGAGDTAMAAFVLARAAGATPLEAAVVANHAAGVVVGKMGTAAVTPTELLRALAD